MSDQNNVTPTQPPVQPPAQQPMQAEAQPGVQPLAQPLPGQAGATSSAPATKHRVHHSYIWLGSLRAIGIFIVAIIIASFSSIISLIHEVPYLMRDISASSDMIAMLIIIGIIVGVIALILGLVFGLHALSYKYLWYEVGPEEFSLYSGILVKKRVHVPYQKIQSVDLRMSLLQRLFGVCNVSIDTAGGAANKAVLVPYLSKQHAQALKEDLYLRRQCALSNTPYQVYAQVVATQGASVAPGVAGVSGMPGASGAQPRQGNILDIGDAAWNQIGGVFAGGPVELERVTYEYGLSNKELFLSGLSNNSGFAVAVLAVIAGLGQIVGMLFEAVPQSEDALADAIINAAFSYSIEATTGFIIGAILLVSVVVWAFSILGSIISYGGFHARRRGDRIEVERGLLQHQSQSVSIERIQNVVIKQSVIRKFIGYCEISLGKVDASDGSESSGTANNMTTSGIVLHPFVKVDRVGEILSAILPEYEIPSDTIPLSEKALRRGIIRRSIWQGLGFWLAIIMAFTQIIVNAIASDLTSVTDLSMLEDVFSVYLLNCIAVIVYVICALIFVFDIIDAVLWYKGSGFAVSRRFMMVCNSGFGKQTTVYPKNKIQYGYTKTNPLQRVAHTATINTKSAAGAGVAGTTITLIDVSEQAASQWIEWLKPVR